MKKCAEKITLQCIFVLVNISPCPCVSPAVNITAFESSNYCVFMPNPYGRDGLGMIARLNSGKYMKYLNIYTYIILKYLNFIFYTRILDLSYFTG